VSILVEAPKDFKDKLKAVEITQAAIEKTYGKGTLVRMGSKEIIPTQSIPTGIYSIDNVVCGIGGVPRGKITEIFGPESSGKTTLALHVVGNAQKMGGLACYIDMENVLDPIYAAALGVDVDNLFLSQPDYAEQALDVAENLIHSRAVDVLVIDSVAALVPKAELEGEMGESHMGLQARLMSQALRKITAIVNKTNTAVIFINQIREKIGVTYGSNETTAGGRALRFYSSLRLDVRRIAQKKQGEDIIGAQTKVKAVKNKTAVPFKETLVDIIYGQGFDRIGNLIDIGLERGIIEKSGTWYSFAGMRLQGKDNWKDHLLDNPGLADQLLEKINQ
jgi:recombination protein RecA